MIVVTDQRKAEQLAELGVQVAVADNVNGNVRGVNCSVFADNEAEMAEIIGKLQQAKAGVVMPLPVGVDINDVPRKVAELARTASVKYPSLAPSPSLMNAAHASTIKQTNPMWNNALDAQAEAFAEMTSTTREWADGVMLACIAGITAGIFSAGVRPGWTEQIILFIHLLGGPGSGKSPLVSAITGPLFDAQINLMQGAEGRINITGQSDRWIWADGTVESICRDLAKSKGGGLKHVDEADAHYGGGMSRYKNATDRGTWKALWSGGPGIIDRVGNAKPLSIRHMAVALICGIQPANLKLIFDGHNDGLADRAIVLTTDQLPIQRHGPESACTQTWQTVVDNLLRWRAESDGETVLPLTPAALDVFEGHRFEMLNKARERGRDIDGWTSKMPAHIARIAAALTLADGALNDRMPTCIDVDAVTRAIAYSRLLNSHRRRAMLETGSNNIQHIAVDMARFILESKAQKIDTYEMRHANQVMGVRDEEVLRKVLAEMHAARWILTPVPRRRDEALPRTVEINPEVFTRI